MSPDQPPVQPGRPISLDLRVEREIRADGEGCPALAARVFEHTQLDDRSRRTVARRVEIGKADVMDAAIDAVDHGKSGPLEFVIMAPFNQLANDLRFRDAPWRSHNRPRRVRSLPGQRLVHPLDDVTAQPKGPQPSFRLIAEDPLATAYRLGKAETFEISQASDLLDEIGIRLPVERWRDVDDAVSTGIGRKLAIERGPAVRLDLAFKRADDVALGPWSQLLRDEVLSAVAQSRKDIVAVDNEVLPIVGAAAQNDMDMWVVGVPVIDADPIELCSEVLRPGASARG